MAKNGEEERVAPEAMTLADMVQYQEGSIVSRTMVKKPTGTITLFAFDKGQALSEHTAPFDALVQVTEGEADITISGRTHRLNGGQVIIMPAGQPHSVRAPGRFKMLLCMIRS